MEVALLASKLRIPPQPQRAVQRIRLLDALERGIAHYKLSLISAPAGYGKTTLLSQWAQSSHIPAVWLSLSEEDNDVGGFFQYLLTAWAEAQPNIRESPLGLLLGRALPDTKVVLSAFINFANALPTPVAIVLDDYHLIKEPSIHQALTFLLDHLPPTIHFVLASRAEPPLPLAKYRARTELLEIRADDLQFLLDETATFLAEVMGLHLPHDKVATLQAQLEGWIAGLQLAALTLRRHDETVEPVVSGKHRFIADYLSEDVLAHLSDNKRMFLLQTSILDSLCDSLCDAVTRREDSQAMLETLERENLFLVPLDDSRQWFRYHRLFAEFLYGQLQRHYGDEVAALHCRAARWYFQHDLPEPAFQHALAGDDAALVNEIFERYLHAKLDRGEIRVIGQWIDSLPAEWYVAYPRLGFAKVGFLAFTGALEASLRCLDEGEQRLRAAESDYLRLQARVTANRCLLACIQNDIAQVETYASRALQELSEDDLTWRLGVYRSLGDTYRQNGRWDAAKEWYLKALSVPSPVVRVVEAHGFGALADLSLRQGRLRDAVSYWRKALAAIQDRENWGRFPLPVIGWVYIRLAEILYEWNEVTEAWRHISRGLEQAELGGDVRTRIAGYLLAGRVKLTQGDIEAAAEYLERAHLLVENALFPEWISRFERFQVELWLAQGKLRSAVDWADRMLRTGTVEQHSEKEIAQLAAARVWIVKGSEETLDQALALLEPLHQAAESEGRIGICIEALALQSLGHWKCRVQGEAMTALERALQLAEPEGYMRVFADLEVLMARLLQEAHSRVVLPDYVEKLLAVFGADLAFSTPRDASLLEPLTPREREILQLIAVGLTNHEIAQRLIVSPETIKKHSGSIYSKLGVRNRTEAVVRAREMDLLY